VVVVEQPPKGGGDVMIHRDCSYMCCHGSKGPWLEVSFNVTCSTQVLSTFAGRGEVAQDERSRQAWIRDKVETGALNTM
jgi:hypothetical protein